MFYLKDTRIGNTLAFVVSTVTMIAKASLSPSHNTRGSRSTEGAVSPSGRWINCRDFLCIGLAVFFIYDFVYSDYMSHYIPSSRENVDVAKSSGNGEDTRSIDLLNHNGTLMGGSNHAKLQLPRETRHHLLHASSIHPTTKLSLKNIQQNHNMYVMSKREDKRFFICTAPKTGCTAWKTFFLFVNENLLLNNSQVLHNPGSVHIHAGNILSKYYTDALDQKDLVSLFTKHDRFIIARNPYVRFVSSYQDWLSRVGKRRDQVPFPIFLSMYKSRNFSSYRYSPIDHIDPITTFCKFNKVGYTSVLRVEEQPLWYDAFLETYGLDKDMETFMASGNRIFSHALQQTLNVSEYIPVILGRQPWPGEEMKSSHHRGSADKLLEYYTTPELVDEVSRLFWKDFVHFQYPLWDGNPETFRYT